MAGSPPHEPAGRPAFADGLVPVEVDAVRVHYLEVYGGKVTAASKQYTGSRAVGHRLFDVAVLPDVLRTADRGVIAKARFQDYDRTPRRRAR